VQQNVDESEFRMIVTNEAKFFESDEITKVFG